MAEYYMVYAITNGGATSMEQQQRRVSVLLTLGIFLVPFVFSWFLLKKGYSNTAKLIGFGWLAFFILAACFGGGDRSPVTPPSLAQAASTAKPLTNTVRANNGASQSTAAENADEGSKSTWSYSVKEDKMRNTKTKYATVSSTNTLNFDFPYDGGSSGIITIRNSSKFGKDILLRISKGQFNCGSTCSVTVKFDNGKLLKYSADTASDGSIDVIFIQGFERFVKQLKTAKKMMIEVEFFQAGSQQLEFDVSGLEWS